MSEKNDRRTVKVPLADRSYIISIFDGALDEAGSLMRASLKSKATANARVCVISNATIDRLYGPRTKRSLQKAGYRVSSLLIGDGERSKSLRTAEKAWSFLISNHFERSDFIVALGGGVVGDLAGFVAAGYLRGIRYIQIPTTLLAQIDSSVGGKTAVNHKLGKNLIGAFHQPSAVVIDPSVLASLPSREFQAGMYEALKYGIIRDASLAESIVAFDPSRLGELIARCCEIKADVVSADEREAGLRQILNFGHTIGHALETVTKYRRLKHGEAVGYGMKGASLIAKQIGLLTEKHAARIIESVESLGRLPSVHDLDARAVNAAISHDKKVKGGRPVFVLPDHPGSVVLRSDISPAVVLSAIKTILST